MVISRITLILSLGAFCLLASVFASTNTLLDPGAQTPVVLGGYDAAHGEVSPFLAQSHCADSSSVSAAVRSDMSGYPALQAGSESLSAGGPEYKYAGCGSVRHERIGLGWQASRQLAFLPVVPRARPPALSLSARSVNLYT